MSNKKLLSLFVTVVMLFSFVLAACGAPAAEEPVVVGEEPEVEEPVVEEPEEEEVVEEPAEEEVVEEEVEEEPVEEVEPLDVNALLMDYLNNAVPAMDHFGTVSVDALSTELAEGEVFLVDVRELAEGADQGYIEGSVNFPLRELAQHVNEIPTDMPVVVYCGSGHRSALGMVALQVLGYEDVRSMAGGFSAWTGAEYPTTDELAEVEDFGDPGFDAQVFELVDGWLAGLPEGWGVVKADGLNTELAESELFLLDVRSEEEYAGGYIEGSVNAPLNVMLDDTSGFAEPMVVYCGSGHRSAMAMAVAQMAGFESARSLAGGIKAWKAAELPLAGVLDVEALVDDYTQNVVPTLGGYGTIKAEDLSVALIEDAPFLLDVRQPDELDEAGYIEGAVNIPLRELAQHLNLIPTDQPIVVYCGSGHRSAIGMTALHVLGYTEAKSLVGGISGWVGAGNPVVDGPALDPVDFGAPDIDELLVEAVDETLMGLPEGWGTVKPDALNVELIEDPPLLFDGRTAEQYAGGWIEGAVNIPIEETVLQKELWPATDANMVVYCGSGHRSAMQMFLFNMLGFENVRSMTGGVGKWTEAGFPLVTE